VVDAVPSASVKLFSPKTAETMRVPGPVALKAHERQSPEILGKKLETMKRNMRENEKKSAQILQEYFHAKNCAPH